MDRLAIPIVANVGFEVTSPFNGIEANEHDRPIATVRAIKMDSVFRQWYTRFESVFLRWQNSELSWLSLM
jgi:hypothetical protein